MYNLVHTYSSAEWSFCACTARTACTSQHTAYVLQQEVEEARRLVLSQKKALREVLASAADRGAEERDAVEANRTAQAQAVEEELELLQHDLVATRVSSNVRQADADAGFLMRVRDVCARAPVAAELWCSMRMCQGAYVHAHVHGGIFVCAWGHMCMRMCLGAYSGAYECIAVSIICTKAFLPRSPCPCCRARICSSCLVASAECLDWSTAQRQSPAAP